MYIVKVGGGEAVNLAGVAGDLASIEIPCVVVLGANAVRDDLAARLGSPRRTLTSVSGYTSVFSDETALDVIMRRTRAAPRSASSSCASAAGSTRSGCPASTGHGGGGAQPGESGSGKAGKTLIRRDLSGKPRAVNAVLLRTLLDGGYTPVLTIPIADRERVRHQLGERRHRERAPGRARRRAHRPAHRGAGFLDDAGDPESVVATMSRAELERREAQVEGRMKRKMLALRRLFEAGAAEVVIGDGRVEHPIRTALDGAGTVIR